MRPEISRAAMSPEERELRARANQILSGAGLVHGYLSVRQQKCGKPNCRCTRGHKHEVFVLVLREPGKNVQIPVPRQLAPEVQRWVDQEKALQELLGRISAFQVERLQELKRHKPKG